jgi:DNA-binding response OmpR family regulator
MSECDTSSQRPTILIIEDDETTATDLQNGLMGAGYVVQRAESAGEALVTLEWMRPDLIFIGLMLPDTDGLILCSTLKAHVPAPIIILGADSDEVGKALALQSGAVNWLTKPVDRGELLAQVKAAVQRQCVESDACSRHPA